MNAAMPIIRAIFIVLSACIALLSASGSSFAEKSHRWGFIDKVGNFVIEPQFAYAGSFSDGLARVRIDGRRWGFIDRQNADKASIH